MNLTFRNGGDLAREELVALYDALGWIAYTRDPARLQAAVAASLAVVTAWDGDRLVGLARVVGDGLTIVYVQDILVLPELHRSGVGRELFTRVLAPFSHVRQKVLITDGTPEQRGFYEAMGFTEVNDMDPAVSAYVRFS